MTLTLFSSIVCISAFADFGSGVLTIAEDAKIIKTGLVGKKLTFSDADFKQGLCITDFEKITVTKLPLSTEGTLMLAGRRIREGSIIKRKNLASLVFIPASKDVKECKFSFTIDDFAGGAEIDFVIKFTDTINYEPKIDAEYSDSLAMQTQREIGIYGKMQATDAENDELEYMIISYPTDGTLEVISKKSGEYRYTPSSSFVGNDKFIYVVRDEWGNFSTPATVNITVTKRMCEAKYADMENRDEYNAAVAMTAMGIMSGTLVGDNTYFEPDKQVSKAEFVAMAMKSMGIKPDSESAVTFFDDNDEIPKALIGYVAKAQQKGIVIGAFKDGELKFEPNKAITKYEAALIMSKLTDTSSNDTELPVFNDISAIPSWARASVYTMYQIGVFTLDGSETEANKEVTRADAADYLYRLMNK